MTNLYDIPAQLEKLAGEIRSGSIKEETCIVILTTEEDPDYASYFFGQEMTYGGAIEVVSSLLEELESEASDTTVVTVN